MIITRHVFSAEIVFDSVEFDGRHFQVATLDLTGDFEKRQLLIICERVVELVHNNVEEFLGNIDRISVFDC